jgi:8-oxo-dGTP diphosphatase
MNNVKIGIGVIIIKENEILLGCRKNAHGEGCWGFPGGHLEFGETPEQCAIRETLEETSLEITDIVRGPWTNDYFAEENKHYITLFMLAKYKEGEVLLIEPEKCTSWKWFNARELPTPLFLPINNLLQQQGSMVDIIAKIYNE